jgi:hypothetical protein
MQRLFEIGDHVVITYPDQAEGQLAIVEEHHKEYPTQKWYRVRYLRPIENALYAEYFYDNATHGMYREIELRATEGDDFAEPPTVGNEVI